MDYGDMVKIFAWTGTGHMPDSFSVWKSPKGNYFLRMTGSAYGGDVDTVDMHLPPDQLVLLFNALRKELG